MKKYDGGGEIDYTSPEDVADAKKRAAEAKAYNKAMPEADTSFVGSLMNKLTSKKEPRDAVRGQRGYSKGGGVFRAAANGIAQRGKTKGKMVTMCGGGKM
jgi:ribosomal protein L18